MTETETETCFPIRVILCRDKERSKGRFDVSAINRMICPSCMLCVGFVKTSNRSRIQRLADEVKDCANWRGGREGREASEWAGRGIGCLAIQHSAVCIACIPCLLFREKRGES